MKKISSSRNERKFPTAKHINMKLQQEDNEKNKSVTLTGSECMVEHQAQYIENLQQQIYMLENEVEYLRTNILERNKQHPSMIAEGERMVKKIADCHNEIKNIKIECKRKQTTIDLLRSEKERFQKQMEEIEEKFRIDKCKLLEEIITFQKEKDALEEINIKNEESLLEQKQENKTLQEEFDNLEVEIQQLEREKLKDKELIKGLVEDKEKLQKSLFEARMTIDTKSSTSNDEALKELKDKIVQLYEEIEVLKRSRDHEMLLRERLHQDNSELIRRHADVEAELAEVKAHLREEQSRLSSLEQVHLNTILEASEAKGRDQSLKEEIEHLNSLLKEERERSCNLSHQLADELRFKSREEENFINLNQRFNQHEEKMKLIKNENITLTRDNTYFKDQTLHLKQQLQSRDQEVLNLKQKVQEMQVSVEEFIQSNQAATRLAGERFKQLGQLAKSIQALTNAEIELSDHMS